jgi:hypothetical protein
LKDEEAIDWCKRISKLSLIKGNKLKEGHGGSPRRRALGVCMKREKKGGGNVKNFLVLMCARIKHGKNVCRN